MNAKQVLNKIIAALKAEKAVDMTYAKLADGTILESPTFDVGEAVDVVSEDGTKSPAPAGEHEVILKDSEGNDVRIKIMVDSEGKITERENVEEATSEEEPKAEEEMSSEETSEEVNLEEEGEDSEESKEVSMEDVVKSVEEMSYRIEELEKKLAEMQVEDEVEEEVEAEEEEELPKLDGAPVQASKVNVSRKAAGRKTRQSAFLSKLYN